MKKQNYSVILASKSPRRREILEGLGVSFAVVVADADESSELCDPESLVKTLALRKGVAVRDRLCAEGQLTEDTLIIASDTVVALEHEILGKPQDEADAARMLRALSGRSHTVYSGVALLTKDGEAVAADATQVHFSVLSDAWIDRYIRSREPMDKAGSYAVQGLAAAVIDGISGDYFNVVGLPVRKMNVLLQDFLGIDLFDLG